MTTYTLTDIQYTELTANAQAFDSSTLAILRSLKPNSQEPFARLAGDDVSRWLEFDSSHGTFDKPVGTPVFLHPAPMSKEDMVNVLETAKYLTEIVLTNITDYPLETEERILEWNKAQQGVAIMQSAIKGMK